MKRILNESKEGWKMVEEETNPCALITLMVSWIDCLMVRYIILNNTMQYNNFSYVVSTLSLQTPWNHTSTEWLEYPEIVRQVMKWKSSFSAKPFSAANLPCSAPLTLDNSRDR